MPSAPRRLLPVALAVLCLAVAAWGPLRAGSRPTRASTQEAPSPRPGPSPAPGSFRALGPAAGPPRARTSFAASAPSVLAPRGPTQAPAAGLASLEELEAKAVAKTQKQLAAAQAQRDKLLARQAKLDAKQADWEASLAGFEADLIQAPLDLAAAEQALAEALALPADTPEQVQLRKQAIQAAQKALKQAKKALAKAQKQVPRLIKRLAKLASRQAQLADKLAAVQATIAALSADLEVQQQPFHFSSLNGADLAGQLTTDGGQPLAHATVLLVDPLDPSEELEGQASPAVHWRGFSQDDGGFGGALRLPAGQQQVDLVVSLPGFSGPYTHESLRETWGLYAPAARVTLEVAELGDVTLQLTEQQP